MTGRFYKYKQNVSKTSSDSELIKLPTHWNSLKKAGGQMIPNIMVSPLQSEDDAWKRYKYLSEHRGPPGRNRILIQYKLKGKRRSDPSDTVPFSVVTLALSLVLLFSRFTATLHLAACLGDRTKANTLDKEYLQEQYACTAGNVGMTCSKLDKFKIYFG